MRALLVLSLVLVLAACGFDRARWAAARGVDASDNPRASMVCDAVAAGVVPGATREKVRFLLGPPDEGPPGEEHPEIADIYEVGLEYTSPDLILFSVAYGSDDIVDEVVLTHDWGSEYLRPSASGACGGDWSFVRER
jgi:hypothetical protein